MKFYKSFLFVTALLSTSVYADPDTGSESLNKTAKLILDTANYGSQPPYIGGGGSMGGGAGGSWGGDDGGYDGGGGSTGGSGAGGSWEQCSYESNGFNSKNPISVCNYVAQYMQSRERKRYSDSSITIVLQRYDAESLTCYTVENGRNINNFEYSVTISRNCDNNEPEPPPRPDPKCGKNQHLENGICVNDKPQDCDSNIQDCDKDGKPVCDCCDKLDTIIGNQQTQISNQSTIIDQIYSVNSSIQTTNSKLDAIEQAIINKEFSANIDTGELERKLDEIKQAIIDKQFDQQDLSELQQVLNDILRAINDKEVDLRPAVSKLDQILQSIKAIDINQVTKRQDEANTKLQNLDDTLRELDRDGEQSDILNDIRNTLKSFKFDDDGADNPDKPKPPDPLEVAEQEYKQYDPWGAIKGFDISQNRINATKQCPADKSFTLYGKTLYLRISVFCDFLAMLAPAFLAIAYITGAMIIVRGGD